MSRRPLGSQIVEQEPGGFRRGVAVKAATLLSVSAALLSAVANAAQGPAELPRRVLQTVRGALTLADYECVEDEICQWQHCNWQVPGAGTCTWMPSCYSCYLDYYYYWGPCTYKADVVCEYPGILNKVCIYRQEWDASQPGSPPSCYGGVCACQGTSDAQYYCHHNSCLEYC